MFAMVKKVGRHKGHSNDADRLVFDISCSAKVASRRVSCGHIESTAAALRCETFAFIAGDEAAYRGEMRISLSSSVILTPGWSRKNRISEEGSLEEYTPLT
jgi:hypothetical protein